MDRDVKRADAVDDTGTERGNGDRLRIGPSTGAAATVATALSARTRGRSRHRAVVCRRFRSLCRGARSCWSGISSRQRIAGRDIFFDQKYALSLEMRDLLEALVPEWLRRRGRGARTRSSRYTKLFWINSGPHNNLTARKFVLECSPDGICARPARGRRDGARMPSRVGRRAARSAAGRGSDRCSSIRPVRPRS